MINIYVANLSFKTTEDEIRKLFEGFGDVSSVKLITDKYSGESKGFAFVEMPDKSQGEEAINSLNGKEFEGRSLKVNEARPKPERRGGGGRGGFGGRGGGFGNRNGGGRI